MARTVSDYADLIMVMVREDIADGTVPAGVASFTDLHDHVDANEYLIHADVPWGTDDPDSTVTNAVTDEVSRRLPVQP
jgi:hypothetical protein